MPEYLAPGVYVEETSFRARSIQGVGTSTTGFIGLARKGPVDGVPQLVTSFAEYERLYGGLEMLDLGGQRRINYLAYGVRGYFNEGGSRLYIARVFQPTGNGDSRSRADLIGTAADARHLVIRARYPGSANNGTLLLSEQGMTATETALDRAVIGSLARNRGTPRRYFIREALGSGGWREYTENNQRWEPSADGVDRPDLDGEQDWLITLSVEFRDADGVSVSYEGLGLDADHPRALGRVMAAEPATPTEALANPLVLDAADVNGVELHVALLEGGQLQGQEDLLSREMNLADGNDGAVPALAGFEDGLARLGDVDDIAIVAAPGTAALGDTGAGVRRALITHAEQSRFRIAVLDPPENQGIPGIRVTRGLIDSSYAALYYPWVVITNPLARPGNEAIPREVTLPPSGHICGIYARNDALRGVWKTPANEVVREAVRFEREINHPQQEVLNPMGINCLRFLTGRGHRVYGGRLATSDREVVYVSDRRYLNYLKRSIDVSMQWAVFEPNGPQLWSNIRDAVGSFLYTEWRNGALLGGNPDQAFFVRCDRSTMTQADLDNGRLICEIGVAIIKPAEFVIFRIGQKTADARS